MSGLSQRRRLLAGLTVLAASAALAQDAKRTQSSRVIGTHQIDRYEAIEQVRRDLGKDPKNLTDWALLGTVRQQLPDLESMLRVPGVERSEPPAAVGLENWGLASLDPRHPPQRQTGK